MPEDDGHDEIEAYEQDWYRSLRALAEHQERIERAAPDDAGRDEGSLLTIDGDREAEPEATRPTFAEQDAQTRKRTLAEAAERGLPDELLQPVRDMLLDPDAEIRRGCLEALATRAADVDHALVSRSLLDPDDDVRAAAVRLAAATAAPRPAELIPLLSPTSGAATRGAALEVVPDLLRRPTGPEPEAWAALYAVAAELDPTASETAPGELGEIARAVGVARLIDLARDPGTPVDRRIGAAHLLIAEGSEDALVAVAALTIDEDERIRAAGHAARELVAPAPPGPGTGAADVPAEPAPPSPAVDPSEEPASPAEPSALDVQGPRPEEIASGEGDFDAMGGRSPTPPPTAFETAPPPPVPGPGRPEHDPHAPPRVPGAERPTADHEPTGQVPSPLAEPQVPPADPLPAGEPVPTDAPVGADPAHRPEVPGEPVPPVGPEPSGIEQAAGSEMIAALARTLNDPDDGVRNRARTTLAELSRDSVLAWAREALASEDRDDAILAAWVAERVGLAELAGELLHHAADPSTEERGGFVDALASFSLDAEALKRLLDAIEATRRATAIRVLWNAASRAILPALRPHLADAADDVRAVALEILGESADPGTIEAAERAFGSDPSPTVRMAAIRVIAGADAHRRLASLERALRDPDAEVRFAALEALPKGLGEEVDPLIVQALADPEQRELAVEAIRSSNPTRLEHLALERARALDPEDRRLAVDVLTRLGTETGRQAAMQALHDPSVEVRAAAAAALGGLRDPETVQALGGALRDPEAAIRVEVVRALGVIDHEAVLHHLVASLSDPAQEVRRTASEVLTTWSSPAVARRLAEVLSNPQIRPQATDLLARMGPSATELLVDVALQGDDTVRRIAGELLANIVGQNRFLERLSSVDPDQRLRSIEALGVIGGPGSAAGVMRAVTDPDPRVRLRAVELLGVMGDPRAVDVVERCAHGDPVPDVSQAAAEALRLLRGDAA